MRNAPAIWLLLVALGGGPLAGAEPAIELRTDPLPAELRERMRRWHTRYLAEISPVLGAWRVVARAARRPQRPTTLVTGCQRLTGALARLDRRALAAAPDRSVSLHLERSLQALAEAAEGCTRGAHFLTSWQLDQAAVSWRELRHRLVIYGLAAGDR